MVSIKSESRKLDSFFKVDSYTVDVNGVERDFLNFERGDSVGLVLFNEDTKKFIFVSQSRYRRKSIFKRSASI